MVVRASPGCVRPCRAGPTPFLRESLELGYCWIYHSFFFRGIFLMNYADLVGASGEPPLDGRMRAVVLMVRGRENHKAVGKV